jgi:hypothetical protein
MSVHKGQTAEVTANSLKARVSPGGAQAKDAKGKLVTRPDGFRFKATDVSSDGKWVKAKSNWYANAYLKPAGSGGGGRPEDKRLRRPKASVAAARRWKTCKVGMCLYTVQEWMGGLHGIPWAEAAWQASKQKHRGDKHPPAGVPVYWHNPHSKYGHIALSTGGGRCRSTDWPSRNRVGEARIDDITRRWGLRYLGWAGDMAPGGDIPGVKN